MVNLFKRKKEKTYSQGVKQSDYAFFFFPTIVFVDKANRKKYSFWENLKQKHKYSEIFLQLIQ